MNLSSATDLAKELKKSTENVNDIDVAACPPFVYIQTVAGILVDSKVGVGAQNGYFEKEGAFTGEISMGMLKDVGCQYVILGHSERRHVLHETSDDVNLKTHAALALGLTPIVCVGELLAEREAGVTDSVIRRQFDGSFSGLTGEQMKKVVIAYEPVWAIGTGKVATPDQAEEVHLGIRGLLTERYGKDVAETVIIQYGGSVKADNAKEILGKPNVDGALVGGASLKIDSFMGIIDAVR